MAAQWLGQFSHRILMLAVAAQGVVEVKEHPTHIILSEFADSLGEFAQSLKGLQRTLEMSSSCPHLLVESEHQQLREMEAELTAVEQLVIAQRTSQSKLLAFLSCPFLLAKTQSWRESLSRSVGSMVPDSAYSAVVRMQLARTQRLLTQSLSSKLGIQEQAVMESVSAITEQSSPLKCKEVAVQVAEYLRLNPGDIAFAEQLAEAKREIERMGNIMGDDARLGSCITALEKGLGFRGGEEEEGGVVAKSRSKAVINAQALAPLSSFICPITNQVMKDPVQIASGETVEKSAIEQWFKEGNTTSPLTKESLRNTKMTPNHALRQSITEWKERNYNIRFDKAESRLMSFQPMEQARGARDIKELCEEDAVNKASVASRKLLIPQLIRLADPHYTPTIPAALRELCFQALTALALDHQENQQTLVFEGVIDVLVRCLRNRDEAEPAINLLKLLSESSSIAEIIGLKPDAVLLLVTFLGHENESLVVSVKGVLVNLPTSDANVVTMAEANLMKPLVTRLVEGRKEQKILMARTVGRLQHMPDSSRSLASTFDTINILIAMTSSEDEEEVDAAVLALKNLSSVPSVGVLIADCNGLEVLIKLVSTKQTVGVVGMAYILANVLHAVGNEWPPSDERDADIDSYIETIFMLVSTSSKPLTPPPVQSHLLQGLLGLVKGKDTGRVVTEIMMRRNAFSILTSHFREETRRDSLKLFASLSRKHGSEAWSAIKIHSGTLTVLVNMVKRDQDSEVPDAEKVAAARILAHLPVHDHALTATLRELEMVPFLVKYLNSPNQAIQEAALGALVRFTSPECLELQKELAEMGLIPRFVHFLDSRKHRARIKAAKALANFALSTPRLVKPVTPSIWWQNCFAKPPDSCKLHAGECSVESTFCLLAAEAVDPLLAIVAEPPSEPNRKCTEAALEALFALIADDQHWERGCYVIHQAGGIATILKNLPTCTPRAQEISIDMCERFFNVPQFLSSFGAPAQMLIISVTQNAAVPRTRNVANRILQRLDLLDSLAGSQSHFLSTSSTTSATSGSSARR